MLKREKPTAARKIPVLHQREENLLYVEPIDYFPKSIRKKYKIGEYAKKSENDE